MRISDWSSDVCSSDLPILCAPLGEDCSTYAARLQLDHRRLFAIDIAGRRDKRLTLMRAPGGRQDLLDALVARFHEAGRAVTAIHDSPGFIGQRIAAMVANLRSEEHTSELQSLIPNSYAVFCLKKN